MRPYLEGYRFKVITDHMSLKWLNSIESPSGRIARWALELQQHTFDIEYRKGKLNQVADALSRQPLETIRQATTMAPQCKWWRKRVEEVRANPEKYADYMEKDGQLYRHIPCRSQDEEAVPWKLCVPKPLRIRVLQENHDIPSAGHMGIRRTVARVANRYYWPGMFRDISQYVRRCESCQKYKEGQQRPAGKMLSQVAQEPFATVCTDFIGPLPRSTHGNTMLLVFFDRFSKWVELVPMRRATSEGLRRAFRERILARFGVPKILISDNGVQFTSTLWQHYLKELGVRQQFTAPYTPQENPTERVNRTIKRIIAQLSKSRHQQWDDFLPEIELAVNSSISASTGYSPAFLVQGREPRLPNALFDEVNIDTGMMPTTAEEKYNRMQEAFRIVRQNMERASTDQARHYNLRRRKWTPAIGELVLAKEHHLSKAADGFAAKLAPKYDGPYKILRYISPVIVHVQKIDGGKEKTVNISELKLYNSFAAV
uniref:RNA-directed DNA polymerase n=1 Tax=Bactrocera dorsalis TaxID=27457 RepID=A0A034W800_BACDO